MTDVLIPYTRFLEVRARRLDIAAELSQRDARRPSNVTLPPACAANDERPGVGVRVFAARPAAGVHRRTQDDREACRRGDGGPGRHDLGEQ